MPRASPTTAVPASDHPAPVCRVLVLGVSCSARTVADSGPDRVWVTGKLVSRPVRPTIGRRNCAGSAEAAELADLPRTARPGGMGAHIAQRGQPARLEHRAGRLGHRAEHSTHLARRNRDRAGGPNCRPKRSPETGSADRSLPRCPNSAATDRSAPTASATSPCDGSFRPSCRRRPVRLRSESAARAVGSGLP